MPLEEKALIVLRLAPTPRGHHELNNVSSNGHAKVNLLSSLFLCLMVNRISVHTRNRNKDISC